MSAVDVQGLSYRYAEKDVLHNVALALREGLFVGIIGPNGAGKSTLLRIIGGILRNYQGRVRVFGQDLKGRKPRELARQLGYVAQEAHFSLNFTVEEIVALGRFPYLKPFQRLTREDRAAVSRALEHAGLGELRKRAINNLSSGERQRTVIARAIAGSPRLLLLDEPTSHLDLHHQYAIMSLLKSLNDRGTSVVVVNHDLNLASQYCQHLVLMNGGRIFAEGAPAAIITEEIVRRVYQVESVIVRHPDRNTPQVLLGR